MVSLYQRLGNAIWIFLSIILKTFQKCERTKHGVLFHGVPLDYLKWSTLKNNLGLKKTYPFLKTGNDAVTPFGSENEEEGG